ncbi:MAG: hypothetical protein AUG02_07650 [Chloroflexi bacterium 13_1_20CM_2_70_9]|nr:MAG: hypothetical protein AUG02_07650 [Chloroflexi bacterium 13_1_20CM_2_70_9]
MKAAVMHEFGPPEVLRYEDVPDPVVGRGEVLLRVRSVSVNRTHCLRVRSGEYFPGLPFPHVLGVDPAGTVEAVGDGVHVWKRGDRVVVHHAIACGACDACRAGEGEYCDRQRQIGIHRWGGYAEYVSVPAQNVHPVPEGLTFPEATVVVRHAPLAFALARRAELRAGEWALVMGAAGALGGFVVQVAKLVGAHVIAAASSDERAAAARECGADIAVNYRAEDLLEAVLRVTEGRGVDVVFENVGDRALWPKSFGSLGFRGRLVTAGAHAGGRVELDLGRLYHRLQRIIASPRSSLAVIERTLAESRAGRIRSVRIDRVLPLAEAAVGHRLLQERQVIGKVVLEPPAA